MRTRALDRAHGPGHKPALTNAGTGLTMAIRFARTIPLFAAAAGVIATVGLTGCESDEPSAAAYIERPVEQIYSDAWRQIRDHNWKEAAKQFDEVERQHPYSE